ncbi:MAG: hypothetical protein CMK09_02270 [Ponticaulis sp.]|nr:hypothetical protein [Ponticaulis sp.]
MPKLKWKQATKIVLIAHFRFTQAGAIAGLYISVIGLVLAAGQIAIACLLASDQCLAGGVWSNVSEIIFLYVLLVLSVVIIFNVAFFAWFSVKRLGQGVLYVNSYKEIVRRQNASLRKGPDS